MPPSAHLSPSFPIRMSRKDEGEGLECGGCVFGHAWLPCLTDPVPFAAEPNSHNPTSPRVRTGPRRDTVVGDGPNRLEFSAMCYTPSLTTQVPVGVYLFRVSKFPTSTHTVHAVFLPLSPTFDGIARKSCTRAEQARKPPTQTLAAKVPSSSPSCVHRSLVVLCFVARLTSTQSTRLRANNYILFFVAGRFFFFLNTRFIPTYPARVEFIAP